METIPQDYQAEQVVLGAMIINNTTIEQVAGILDVDSFGERKHQQIYSGILKLAESGKPVDEILLISELESTGSCREVDIHYLADLVEQVPSSGNIAFYAGLVKEKAILRDIIKTAQDMTIQACDPKRGINDLLCEASQKIEKIQSLTTKEDYVHVKSAVSDLCRWIEEISEKDGELTGISTGFLDIDKNLLGLQPSDLIIIAARPSMGKTALALNMASNIAMKQDEKGAVLIFSLEMSRTQLVSRMLSAEARVDSKKLKTGKLDQEEWDRLIMAAGLLSGSEFYINDSGIMTSSEVVAVTKKLNSKLDGGLSAVFIDYMQLMTGKKNKNQIREQEIAEISRSLKALAKDLNIPVVALSQLNRGLESRSDKHPKLSDLRESGAIEQDADVIMFIYRDEHYNSESDRKGTAEIIIAKHRNGEPGVVDLSFQGKFTKFGNISKQEPPRIVYKQAKNNPQHWNSK